MLQEGWILASIAAAFFTGICLALLARGAMWRMRAEHYRIHILAGARPLGMHVRSQIPLVMSFVVPALLAQVVMYLNSLNVDYPPPLSPTVHLAAGVGIVLIQVALGSATAHRIRLMLRSPQNRVHHD